MIAATVILDSISPLGYRLAALKLRYPRFIHAEFMTHRAFSRNASSSRAAPTSKLLAEVRSDDLRAAPIFWGKNQSGMQAEEELSRDAPNPSGSSAWGEGLGWVTSPRDRAVTAWRIAALAAADSAEHMAGLGAHKQIVNRILEPFTHINVVCSFTDFANFEALRCHPAAQPEMRALAEAMRDALNASEPFGLRPGEWHLPFVDTETWKEIEVKCGFAGFSGGPHSEEVQLALKTSVARCARVSYESFETGKRSTIEEDLRLYDKLVGAAPIHASPAEHQATPDQCEQYGLLNSDYRWFHPHQHGNFTGWIQYRKTLPGESS